jgi:MtN3 and saliva related transmembrane protein
MGCGSEETPLRGPSRTMIQWIGIVAGFLTTISFVPQILRTWRRQSADDLSLTMLVTFTVGVFGWLVYGLLSHQFPVVAANGVMLVLAVLLLGMKVRFG